jgi:hypothetical protein
MTTELSRDGLRQRHDTYLADHYMAAHVTVVSLALGVGGVTAASLIVPSPRFQGNQLVFMVLWLASLLATIVAYAGTMIGAIVLPARLPAVADLLLPLLLGVSEFLLFGVLAYPATGAPCRYKLYSLDGGSPLAHSDSWPPPRFGERSKSSIAGLMIQFCIQHSLVT